MKVTLELTGTELVLLYLMTGNEVAGEIVRTAARNAPRIVKVRKPRKQRQANDD
jgi:hypothetical protein